ncbi:MAG TPA: class I SAM-dependent methyltransferase [Symbiobacteriaceae bacterium]|nr:class I SAM-dependent methyltransferase [Symbiobacteriaceae bacterium]
MHWDEIYSQTNLKDLHWYPGEPDEILKQAVDEVWLPEPKVLDIGSGQGTDAIFLAGRGYQVTALDLSQVARDVALQEATRAGVQIDYHVGNALTMPFADGTFDSVVERGCFHHIARPDWECYVDQIARVLKPNGVFLYRSFCWKSQFRTEPEALLTEEAVRSAFGRRFTFVRFGEYMGRGQNGRSSAEMHWGLLVRM